MGMLSQQRLPLNSNTEIRCIYMATIIGNAGRKYQLSHSAAAPAVADLCRLLTVKGHPRVVRQQLLHSRSLDIGKLVVVLGLPCLPLREPARTPHEVRTVARNTVQRIERLQIAR